MKHNNRSEELPLMFNHPYISEGGDMFPVGSVLYFTPHKNSKYIHYTTSCGQGGLVNRHYCNWTTKFNYSTEFDLFTLDELL